MNNINLCTYFDKNYLAKFLTCRNSILKFEKNSNFYCLCLDDYTYKYLNKKNFDNVNLIKLDEIENHFLDLKYAKKNREKVEYYFTLSPFLPLYVLQKFKLYQINYIDSDLYFFDNPQKIINFLGDNSIILIEHGIKTERFGKYNVGWLTFNNDETSISCLKDWSQNCIHWCYDYVEGDKFADQKYLDSWPKKFKNIKILPYEFSSAPWNITNENIKIDENNKMNVNSNSLVFFHFHGLNIYKNFFSTGLSMYNKKLKSKFVKHIYKKYIFDLEVSRNQLDFVEKNIRQELKFDDIASSLVVVFKKFLRIIKQFIFLDFYRR